MQNFSKRFEEDWGECTETQYCRPQSKPTTSVAKVGLAYVRQGCALLVSGTSDTWQIQLGRVEYEKWSSKKG